MSMMALLSAHLEQISLCAASIADLPYVNPYKITAPLLYTYDLHTILTAPPSFPSPKIFTNALLHPHDITTLIRDTESHERALFSVPPPAPPPRAQDPSSSTFGAINNRRTTTFNASGRSSVIDGSVGGGANAVRAPRRNTAVAAVLGGDLVDRIRRGGGGGVGSGLGYRHFEGRERERGEVDVEVLLEGAEKLCSV